MKPTCRYLQTVGSLGYLLVALLSLVVPSLGQTDLQIMVNGSWSFVVDPQPGRDHANGVPTERRIVIVAPLSDHGHGVYVFSGDDASQYKKYLNSSLITKTGLYYLDFMGVRTFASTRSSDDQPPYLYSPPQVAIGNIQKVLGTPDSSNPRVAISLPVPDYYSTYVGSHGNGMSQSKIAPNHVTSKIPAEYYTTWIVLHYEVTGSQKATISGTLDDGTPYKTATPSFVNSGTGTDKGLGISIVMGANIDNPNSHCDSLSASSFTDTKRLWGGLQIYSRFPGEDLNGNQTDVFDYKCPEDVSMGPLKGGAVGGADCHMAPFNINSAIQ
jgi:hypothetical protein